MSNSPIHNYPSEVPRSLEIDPVMRKIAAEGGVARLQYPHGEPCWVVTGFDDVRSVYGSKSFSRIGMNTESAPRLTEGILLQGAIGCMEEREHVKLRRAFLRELDAPRLSALEERGEAIMSELLDAMAANGGGDYVSQVAKPFALRMLSELLGLSPATAEVMACWVQTLLTASGQAADPAVITEAYLGLGQCVTELVQERRATPANDFISAVANRRELKTREIAILVISLLAGGFESTATMMSKSVLLLQTRSDLWKGLAADSSLVPAAVEELLRKISLAGGESLPWIVREPVTLAGVDMQVGDYVMPAAGMANLDPAVFEDPEDVRFDRNATSHLSFGHGSHLCLGYQIARIELCIGVRALVERYPDARLGVAVDQVRWREDSTIWQLEDLPLTLGRDR
ncbi:cytochrome P450 [Nocardia sp. NPDC004604]|uniref:cytochrome P450 n=1 Tax=Nocardia sp. NPDC004604 TaxID=3157013 RepID=UPI0033ADDC4D